MKSGLAFFLIWVSVQAWGHKPSDSHLKLTQANDALSLRWDIAIKDLSLVLSLDANQDNRVTWGELKTAKPAIESYAASKLKIVSHGKPCRWDGQSFEVVNHTDGAYVVFHSPLRCEAPARGSELSVEYSLFFERDAEHRGLLEVIGAGRTRHLLFTTDSRTALVGLTEFQTEHAFQPFFLLGFEQFWHDLSHFLFLLILLLPTVFSRRGKHWIPVLRFSEALVPALQILAAFTASYSIGLLASSTGMVVFSSSGLRIAIILSVCLAALNNIIPTITRAHWRIALLLGLLHGFHFAEVLQKAHLPKDNLLAALLALELGIDAGQIAILGVVLPILFLTRKKRFYSRYALPILSALAAILVIAQK